MATTSEPMAADVRVTMKDAIASTDWSNSPLGPPETWTMSLRGMAAMLLRAEAEIVLFWGPEFAALYNDAYSLTIGSKHPRALGRPARENWAELWDDLDPLLRGVYETGKTFSAKDRPFYIERFDHGETTFFDVSYSAVSDDDGSTGGVLCIVSETTQRLRAERQLRESEAKFRALVSATSEIVYSISADWSAVHMLEGSGIFSDTLDPAKPWRDQYLHHEDRALLDEAIRGAIRDKAPFTIEHRVKKPGGDLGWVQMRAVPILDNDGQITEWFGTASDVTDRRAEQEHLRLTVNELNHRVKNNMAMVQALAMQSFRDDSDLVSSKERFFGRMNALAQANDLLTGERWAAASSSLRDAVEQALAPHVPSPDRLRIAGGDVQLTSKTAIAFILAVHELATNAVKYGAWSTAHGVVAVSWDLTAGDDAGDLTLAWRETGGPPVTKPTRKGFGTRLIKLGLAAELSGSVDLDFDAAGLVCTVKARLPNPTDA